VHAHTHRTPHQSEPTTRRTTLSPQALSHAPASNAPNLAMQPDGLFHWLSFACAVRCGAACTPLSDTRVLPRSDTQRARSITLERHSYARATSTIFAQRDRRSLREGEPTHDADDCAAHRTRTPGSCSKGARSLGHAPSGAARPDPKLGQNTSPHSAIAKRTDRRLPPRPRTSYDERSGRQALGPPPDKESRSCRCRSTTIS
jgi:hypothetical protein